MEDGPDLPGASATLRRLRPDDAPAYRALMLQAYAEQPYAFTSSVAERAGLPLTWWAARLSEGALATEIVLDAGGDGFLTLNGHPLGRFWETGPQRAYFLPSCWLKEENELELTVTPGKLGDRIRAAELRSLPMND